jgi:hypothetical protein
MACLVGRHQAIVGFQWARGPGDFVPREPAASPGDAKRLLGPEQAAAAVTEEGQKRAAGPPAIRAYEDRTWLIGSLRIMTGTLLSTNQRLTSAAFGKERVAATGR